VAVLKADVLKTGAVLVDLPGVHDANAARGKIARDYVKNALFVFPLFSLEIPFKLTGKPGYKALLSVLFLNQTQFSKR
jgi:hypothetical protein